MKENCDVYGIFGNPVAHSLSPHLHNTLFGAFGINAVYAAFPVGRRSLGMAFEGMRALGIRGVNLTIPFKEEALNFIDEIPEDLDRCVGAINTVVNREGRLFGYNTDGRGFLTAAREELGFNPEGKKVLVLGAGGAARGVGSALAIAHAEALWFYNRTLSRAGGLADYLTGYFPETQIKALGSPENLPAQKIDLVVNATSCGMRAGDPSPFDFRFLEGKAAVYDLIYSPAETIFLKDARRLGFPVANGLGMLAAQAALSFELWTGRHDGVREKMLETLKACSR
ncbi:MAG: shikimate dehydrogenase [Candidatus Omnitrophica bacterium]|nr:shikimate dehydrogenase [Candidatus Omnitrophota bacterium]